MAAWLPKGVFFMRKFMLMLAAVLIMFAAVQIAPAAAAESEWLKAELNEGRITVAYNVKANVKTKVMISKDKVNYTYNLNKSNETFPLQLGNGDYKVMVLEHVSDKSYKVVKQEIVTLNLKDDKVVYLNSVQNVQWTSASNAVQKAKELTKGKTTDEQKVKAIYDYITANIAYDNKLAASASTDYLPDIDRTLKTKKDICYGYSALFAAMLRSLDIPTKLVMGDSDYVDVYHAWNEVYLNGKWVTIDTTVDAGFKQANKKTEMIKSSAKYKAAKQY